MIRHAVPEGAWPTMADQLQDLEELIGDTTGHLEATALAKADRLAVGQLLESRRITSAALSSLRAIAERLDVR